MDDAALLPVTVLYTMPRSVYLTLPGVDCWDAKRDARKWPGGTPVVAHPPCAPWCQLRWVSKIRPGQKQFGRHAVRMIRRWGGVLEQPARSDLFRNQHIPVPGQGKALSYTIEVNQVWMGHQCEKKTWLWIEGVPLEALPPIPFHLAYPTHKVSCFAWKKSLKNIRAGKASYTPLALAEWLVSVARLVSEDYHP